MLQGDAAQYRGWLQELGRSDSPLVPFHWEIEFPEVFERESSGFDVIVGIRRSRERTPLGRPTSRAIRIGSRRCMRRAMATPTWWRTFFAGRSTSCASEAPSD